MPPSRMAAPHYDSAARPPRALEELRDLVRFRDLLLELVLNNLKNRYKRSVLGVAWTLLNPLATMVVMTFAFSRVFGDARGRYPVYVLSGLLLWNFFAQSTAVAMHSLVWSGSNLLKRIYLPKTIFSVAAVGTGAINLMLGLIPLLLIMLALGQAPTPALLFVPVAIVLAVAFVLGVALCLSAVAVFFVDVIEIFQAAVMALFYVTPVIYPPSVLPERWRWLLSLNPIGYLLDTFRYPLHLGRLPEVGTVAIASITSALALIAGWLAFTWKADQLALRA